MNCKPSRTRWRSRRALAAGSVVALALAAAPAAAAGSNRSTPAAGPPCTEAVFQAFSQFGDLNWYAVAPGGDFESGLDGWGLSGASVAPGSDPFAVTGGVGSSSLRIEAGGVVTTPPICVDPTRDTFRFVVRNVSGKTSRIKVEAIFARPSVRYLKTMRVGFVSSTVGTWAPTRILNNVAARALPDGSNGTVTYRFTAERGAMVMDDLHIDPRFKR